MGQTLVRLLLIPILDWLYSKIMELARIHLEKKQKRNQLELELKAMREKFDKAQTKQERDDAAKDLFDKF